tara:strand:- start:1609 stop:2637 length:1029 start_codon:yes stop_codon:yes gene_type:complete
MQLHEHQTSQFLSWLNPKSSVLITNHQNPDGDAVGSATALCGVLLKLGYQATMLMPNDYSENLKWMTLADSVQFYNQNPAAADAQIAAADIIIHLDYNSLKRSGAMESALSKTKAKKIVIDHHQQPDDFAEVLISDTSMSSTCQMVFHFLESLGWTKYLDKSLGEALYTGIATDTGNFRFSSTSPSTHHVAADLLALGVESQKVASRVYDSNTPSRFKLLGRALNNMEVLPEFHAAIISLSAEDLEECGYKKGDSEGFVNYGLSLIGIELSAFVCPRGDILKMSFRSKTTFDVNALARKHFDGGGHRNAAGGSSTLSLADTISKIKALLPEYAEELKALAND